MPEVSDACYYHRYIVFISSSYDLFVMHCTTWLYDSCDTDFMELIYSIPEGEESIRGNYRTL